jgi:hypothetical protein
MNREEKLEIYRQLCWDYNIPPEDIEAVLKGESENTGHFNRESLFIRLLETYPWFTVIQLLEIEEIHKLLNQNIIGRLRSQALRKKYEFVRKRLQEIIQSTG